MNEKDEVVREALKGLRLGVTEFERMDAADGIQHTGEQALDALITQRDQALAEVERLREQVRTGYVDPERFAELCETEAEVERLRAALENLVGDVYLYSLAGDGPEGREISWAQVMQTQGEGIRALAGNTREASDGR